MTETTMKNLRKNGNEILENSSMILRLLCKNVSLLTENECFYDIMFDGSVTIIYGEVRTRHIDSIKATEYLNGILKEIFKK